MHYARPNRRLCCSRSSVRLLADAPSRPRVRVARHCGMCLRCSRRRGCAAPAPSNGRRPSLPNLGNRQAAVITWHRCSCMTLPRRRSRQTCGPCCCTTSVRRPSNGTTAVLHGSAPGASRTSHHLLLSLQNRPLLFRYLEKQCSGLVGLRSCMTAVLARSVVPSRSCELLPGRRPFSRGALFLYIRNHPGSTASTSAARAVSSSSRWVAAPWHEWHMPLSVTLHTVCLRWVEVRLLAGCHGPCLWCSHVRPLRGFETTVLVLGSKRKKAHGARQ